MQNIKKGEYNLEKKGNGFRMSIKSFFQDIK